MIPCNYLVHARTGMTPVIRSEMRAFPADLKYDMPDYERLRARGESRDTPPDEPKLHIHANYLRYGTPLCLS